MPAPALVVLAAGRSSRYGAPKPLVPVGPCGETLPEYTVYDAARVGFGQVVFVVHADGGAELEQHLRARLPSSIAVTFALQQDPPGVPRRHKPWGTAAAIVAAAPHLHGPFAIANADDLYGREALRLAASHLSTEGQRESALVAYRLDQTLSASGGVSRAVCALDSGGRLAGLEEVLDLRNTTDGVAGRTARTAMRRQLLGTEPVSMNLWAFQPAIAERFCAAFPRFLREHHEDDAAEFLISDVIVELVQQRSTRIRVLTCDARWHGITYAADRPPLVSALQRLSNRGVYPSPLFTGTV